MKQLQWCGWTQNSILYRRSGKREAIKCIRWPKKGYFWPFFFSFSRPFEWRIGTFSSQKGGPKWSVRGAWTGKKKLAYFHVFSPAHFKKSTPTTQFALQFKIWHAPCIGCKSRYRPWTQKSPGCPKNVMLGTKKWVFFSILWNYCSGVGDLKVEFYTEDQAKEKQWNALDGQNGYFWPFFLSFSKWSVRGVRMQEKKSWPISTYFHPHISKNQLPRHNSLCSSRSDMPLVLAAKVDIGRGLRKVPDAQKTWC